jgi:imidazolonepropionase-like amidohydrolase
MQTMVRSVRGNRLFDGDRLIDGPVAVLISGGRICDVDLSGADAPCCAEVIDLGDVTLLPGLIDSHVHLCWDPEGDPADLAADDEATLIARARHHARQALAVGVTTMRDLGDRGFATVRLREQWSSGPELLVSGPPITPTGGHCWFLGGEADSDQEVATAVAERARCGADWVKVMATGGFLTPGTDPLRSNYPLATLVALVDAAHRHRLPVAAHAHAATGVADAVRAGVDSVEHCSFRTEHGLGPDPRVIETMARRRIGAGITIARPRAGQTALMRAAVDAIVPRAQLLMRSGVTVALSTDAGVTATKPHDSLPTDLIYAAGQGLTNRQVLQAATSAAAAVCGISDRKGRIAAGFDADLVAVAGNPLHRIDAILDLRAVFRAGVRTT